MKKKLIILLAVLFIGTMSIANAAYKWPTTSDILTSGFGTREKPKADASSNHKGVDIAVVNQPCYPIANGTVRAVRNQGAQVGYGKYIMIDIGNGIWTLYGHLSQVNVTEGQKVTPNDVVAISGNTGNTTGSHLHFEVRSNVVSVTGYFNSATVLNPVEFLNGAKVPTGNSTSKDASTKTESTSATTNKCIVAGCNGTIGTKYYALGNKHYRACTADHMHQYDIKDHVWNTANRCTKCDLKREVIEPAVKEDSGSTATNKCPNCGGLIIDEWLDRSGINHYKACVNGHEWYVEAHVWNVASRCTKCDLKKQTLVQYENLDSVTKNFSDLPTNHWGYEEIMKMVNEGIVKGKGDGTLGTDDKITAEELLVIMNNLATNKGMKPKTGKDGFLANELKTEWSYDAYINLAKILGEKTGENENLGAIEIKLILGNSTEEIKANYKKPITREKAASILGTFIDVKDVSSTNELNAKDWDKVNSIYKKKINKLARKNIFRGVLNPDGSISINPTDELTRVQAFVLIGRLYNIL